jgi:DNA (cytosine-5)-methyltransferase 1
MPAQIEIIDLFAGGGGEATGITNATRRLGLDIRLSAVNHWDLAIQTHRANHPKAFHYCTGIDAIDPSTVVSSTNRRKRVALLWASPECTHHSNAAGGIPFSDQSRASAWLILKWLQELYVERVIIENIPEFVQWGPLGANGRPLKSKRGQTFRGFLTALQSLGYRTDYRVLNTADYGPATTRRRLFIQAARGRRRIVWPTPTRSRPHDDLFATHPDLALKPWTTANEIIDWTIPSPSIFNRKRPLAPKTLKRIETGIQRYWGEYAEPFLVILRGRSTTRKLSEPVPTISCGSHFGLVEPFIDINRGTGRPRSTHQPIPALTAGGNHLSLCTPFITQSEHNNRVHSPWRPMPTITASSRGFGLCSPFILNQSRPSRARPVSEPVPTITTTGAHSLVLPYYGNATPSPITDPLPTITTRDRFALLQGIPCQLDILYRMFQPHELAAATSFPPDYHFAGSKKQITRQIGNAVPPQLAEALTHAALSA